MRNSTLRNSSAKSSNNQISENSNSQVWKKEKEIHLGTNHTNTQVPPKKSTWEVIEHYNPGNALTGAPSGQTRDSPDDETDDDEDEVESILLDHQHEWWNIWALFRRVFKSHRFKVKFNL